MSTTRDVSSGFGRGGMLPSLTRRQWLVIGISLLVGAIIWAIGLPASKSVDGYQLSSLTPLVALLVACLGITAVGVLSASRPWPVVDIVVGGVLGVAGGLFFWGLSSVWSSLTSPLNSYPPLVAVLNGLWVLPALLGGLIIRRPGAAVYTELVAAVLEALLGNQWGFSTVWYGLLEGLGAEVVLALLLYRAFGLLAAMLAAAGAGLTEAVLDLVFYYPTFSAEYKSVYIGLEVASAIVIAGVGGWALTRALAATGALAPLASGRAAERV